MLVKLAAIFFSMILVNNYVLVKFYGICPFLGVSKKLDSAVGMSGAVIFVMFMATAVTFPIQIFILDQAGLSYLQTIVFILVLVLLSWLYLILALYVRIAAGAPILTKRECLTRNGKHFWQYKFRTMKNNCPPIEEIFTEEQMKQWKENFKVDNDPRITKVGNFLRKTSLDELPQLLNIIRGDMSIVGPRPVTQEETEKYGVHRALFLSVMPGLTGYWQANGRSATTYEQRMEMELYYVRNCKFTMDLQIIFQTVAAVLKREGAI